MASPSAIIGGPPPGYPGSLAAPRIFSPDYYRALREIERRHPWARAMRRLEIALIDRHAPHRPRLRTLDVGCGAGLFLTELKALRPAVEPWGGDSADTAARLALQTGLARVARFDACRLPFPDGSFDVAVSNDVLQHMGRDGFRQALAEASRVLAPGGLLLLRTAARRGMLWAKHRDADDYRQFTRKELRRAVSDAGLKPRFAARANWLPSLLSDLRGLFRRPPAGDSGLELRPDEPAWKEALLEGYWRRERFYLLQLGLRAPFGHTLLVAARKPETAGR